MWRHSPTGQLILRFVKYLIGWCLLQYASSQSREFCKTFKWLVLVKSGQKEFTTSEWNV